MIDTIRADQVSDGVVHRATADGIEGATIDEEAVMECADAPVTVEPDLDVVDLVAGMAGAHEMLVPILDPFDRPS